MKAFLQESEKNGEGIMTPTVQAIEDLEDCWDDDIDVLPAEELIDELVNEKNYFYVNFSEPGLEGKITCIDGETYYQIDGDDYAIEMEEDEESLPEDETPVKKLYLNETQSVGYLLKVEDNLLTIQSAIYYLHRKHFVGPGGISSTTEIEALENVEIFVQLMLDYPNKYVN